MDVAQMSVLGDADHGAPFLSADPARLPERDAFAYGILPGPEASRDGLAHDQHAGRRLPIVVAKAPAAKKWNPECREVIGANQLVRHGRIVVRLFLRLSFHL